MDYYAHTFPNGLRLIHLPAVSPVAYCGYAVRAGSRDELPGEAGLAHFVEHMLFKGTVKRKAWHILNRMENVGGELNAYTAKEETLVYSIFMAEHLPRAVELLSDLVFHSTFPQQEIAKELDVIRDEIDTYRDTPSELIFDEFENQLFKGHPLGHSILGEDATLSTFGTESGLSFTRRFYTPENMVFFSMGPQKPERLCRLLEAGMEGASSGSRNRNEPQPPLVEGSQVRTLRATHQAHVILGGCAYNMFAPDRKRYPLYLLNNLLGGPGMNSRLNLSLREKHGLVYNVESGLTAYTDTGVANIYFGTDPKDVEKALQLVRKELAKVRETKLTGLQWAALKKQVAGQLGVATDNRENLALGAGKQFLHHDDYEA
ncbi:MAG: insulinase family protein, partial [Tannerella sp.]|nr:insulinase family protein [Tannerella sp.]